MKRSAEIKSTVGKLKALWAGIKSNPEHPILKYLLAKDQVLARFQEVFSPEGVQHLSEQDFKDFLLFKNNQHWSGLHRIGYKACKDMKELRKALAHLLDEDIPIEDRLDYLIPLNKPARIPGMGRALITAILLVAHPDKYGVWNNTSHEGMATLDIWPKFEHGLSFGKRYCQVNRVLLEIASAVCCDLWTLDFLWWQAKDQKDDDVPTEIETLDEAGESCRFGLEKHLQEFLRDNWGKTLLAKEWAVYEEDGELVGYEYPTSVGRIDLLARKKKGKDWLVVELKRSQTSDDTVGQVLRYMGWVEEHLLEGKEKVQGLIIAHDKDEKISYALKKVQDVGLMLYEVNFSLHKT